MSTGDFKQMVTPCSDPFPMNSDTEPTPAPTPRTDANCWDTLAGAMRCKATSPHAYVPAAFARTLERELAAAQQDKERLDWLASQCYYPYDHPKDGVFVVVSENVAPHGAFTLERDGDRKALRAAIDYARSQPTP